MRKAVDELSAVLLKLQGDGDAGVEQLVKQLGVIRPQLQADLAAVEALDPGGRDVQPGVAALAEAPAWPSCSG